MTQARQAWLRLARLFGACLLGVGVLLVVLACRSAPPAPSAEEIDPALLAFLSRARAAHHRADLLEDEQQLAGAVGELEKVTGGPLPALALERPEVREVLADTYARLADLQSQNGAFERATESVKRGLELAQEPTYFRGHLYEVEGHVEERRARQLEERIALLSGESASRDGRQLAPKGDATPEGAADANRLIAAARPAAAAPPATRAPVPGQAASATELAALREQRERARARALEAFQEAMKIQERVIEESTRPKAAPSGH
jgi:tetratricopeptide (TPR) repeat protein